MAFPSFNTAMRNWRVQADISWCRGKFRESAFVSYFLREAWSLVHKVPDDQRPGFCAEAGIMAGRAGQNELALKFFTKGEAYDGLGGGLSLNCAVALADLGRLDDAIAKARSCRCDQPRALTILANILRTAERHNEAVDTYLRAIEIDRDFLLPVENGLQSAISAWRPSAIRDFINVVRQRWPGETSARVIAASGLSALGYYRDATEEFSAVFVTPDGFDIPENPACSRTDTAITEEEELDSDNDVRSDLTVKEPFKPKHYLLSFAYALLHCGQMEMLQELIRWVRSQSDIVDGDWYVIQGERLRILGDHVLVLSELEPLGTLPPAAATRALSYLDAGKTALARESALNGLVEEYAGKTFNHAQGNPTAICMAVIALADIVDGQFDAAREWADRAIRGDLRCAISWLAKAKALWGLCREDEAVATAADGLRHCPGDPVLYEWYQETCLQSGRLELAAPMQEEMRDAILSRNKQAMFYALQARIAEARFDDPSTRIRMLIRAGEGSGLEFKETLRWNIRAGKQDEEMTYACLKTIAAFLNTNGGTLLIGVADDGRIVGIEKDGFATSDRFLQHLSNKILSALGEVAASYIESCIHPLDGFAVCEVVCKSSKVPVFLRSKSEEEFYVRTGPRSDRIPLSKFLEYARTRFTV
jgi:tetratricopeptide (TPR) repeat protein